MPPRLCRRIHIDEYLQNIACACAVFAHSLLPAKRNPISQVLYQSYWRLVSFELRIKSVRDVFLSLTQEDNSPWAGSCYINLPMAVPQGTVLHPQLDQNKSITHITETQSEWVEFAGLFPALL